MTHNVLISTAKFLGYEELARELLGQHGCTLIEHDRHRAMDEATLIQLAADASAIIAGPEPVTDRVMAAGPRLRVIHAPGVGYDHIDIAAATRRGIAVCIAAGCNHHAVAELALGMMIGLARQIQLMDRAIREGRWLAATGPEFWGKTLGIVGLGSIGKSLALLGRGLGMRLLAHDALPDLTFANQHEISYVALRRLLAESDVVSLHCPLTPQTRHLINAETLALMKPTAYLINTARGALVDEAALAVALRDRRIAGAALDVFEREPPRPDLFAAFDNVLLTSHRGGATHEAIESSLHVAITNIGRVLNGDAPLYRVNG